MAALSLQASSRELPISCGVRCSTGRAGYSSLLLLPLLSLEMPLPSICSSPIRSLQAAPGHADRMFWSLLHAMRGPFSALCMKWLSHQRTGENMCLSLLALQVFFLVPALGRGDGHALGRCAQGRIS